MFLLCLLAEQAGNAVEQRLHEVGDQLADQLLQTLISAVVLTRSRIAVRCDVQSLCAQQRKGLANLSPASLEVTFRFVTEIMASPLLTMTTVPSVLGVMG